jgi:hypothetical protein
MASTTTKTLVVKAGETGILKKNVKIISVGQIGNPDIEAPCFPDILANLEQYQCYYFAWEQDSSGGTGPWEQGSVLSIKIANQSYEINVGIGDPINVGIKIAAAVPNGLMLNVVGNQKGHSNKNTQYVCFNAIPSVAETMTLNFEVDQTLEPATFKFSQSPQSGPFENCACSGAST